LTNPLAFAVINSRYKNKNHQRKVTAMGPSSERKGLYGADGPFPRSGKGLPISAEELAAAATKAAEKVVGSTNDWNKDDDPMKDFPEGVKATPETQTTSPYIEPAAGEIPDIAGAIRERTTTTPTTVNRPASAVVTTSPPPKPVEMASEDRPENTPPAEGELKIDQSPSSSEGEGELGAAIPVAEVPTTTPTTLLPEQSPAATPGYPEGYSPMVSPTPTTVPGPAGK
jgi:hypothetical protein